MDLKELKKGLIKIENNLQTVSFDYSRKMVNTFCDDMTLMRDYLKYRNGAIGFHLDLIKDHLDYYSDLLKQPKGYDIGVHLSFNAGWKMNYLLDDLIFNEMSFYDYFSTYILYVFYGGEIRNKAKGYDPLSIKNKKRDHLNRALKNISWLQMAKFVKNNPDRKSKIPYKLSPILKSSVSEKIKSWNSEFVYKLYKLRSDIIHNKVTPVGNNVSYNSVDGGKFSFSVHGMYRDMFPNTGNSFEDAVEFLIKSYSNSIIECTEALINDIEKNRLVKKEDMFQKWE
ncbi:MAG: hypothetical protein WDZ80_03710 [Candidatus Paceibacterota bacterium]